MALPGLLGSLSISFMFLDILGHFFQLIRAFASTVPSLILSVLYFSPAHIGVPDYSIIENFYFTIKLDLLTYKLKHEIRVSYSIYQ